MFIYNLNTTRYEKYFLRVSHASLGLLKHLAKTMKCPPKRVTKVTVTEK